MNHALRTGKPKAILEKAATGLFVHRYAWACCTLRSTARRMARRGELVLTHETEAGFYYRLPKKDTP